MNNKKLNELSEIRISITSKCNLSCNYCYDDSSRNNNRKIDLKEIKCAVIEGKKQGLVTVSFTGGEPLLEKTRLIDAISYCHDARLKTGILTNGTLVTKQVAEKLKKVGLSWARISLDGSCDSVNSMTRGIGIDSIVESIKHFRECDMPVILRPTITPFNLKDVENLMNLALNNDVQRIDFQPYLPLGNNRDNEFLIPLKETQETAKKLMKLRRKYVGMLDIVLYSGWFEFTLESYDKTPPYLSRCGRDSLFINNNGDIKSCPPMKKVVGNIFNRNLLDVFNKNYFLRQIREPEAYGVCKSCECFRELCRPCPAPTYNVHDTLKTSPVLCPKVRN